MRTEDYIISALDMLGSYETEVLTEYQIANIMALFHQNEKKKDSIPREELISFLGTFNDLKEGGPAEFMRDLDIHMGYEAPTDEEILKHYGWERECESPHELRHFEGSFASGQAANVMMQTLREEYREELLRG